MHEVVKINILVFIFTKYGNNFLSVFLLYFFSYTPLE